MRLSWNEIRARAAAFAREWAGAHYERGEALEKPIVRGRAKLLSNGVDQEL